MEKRLVTRYAMRSAEAADENQRRVEGVFAELAASKPDTVSYIVLRLADDSFLHVSFHNHGDDEVNPIASTAAFGHFQQDHADRTAGLGTGGGIPHGAPGTQTICVGAGWIMLPHRVPLVIAEQFGTLAALHQGSIDRGLGGAPGADQLPMLALRRDHAAGADTFPQ